MMESFGVRNREQWPATLRNYGLGDGAFYFKHVRCGDLFALGLLLRRLGRVAAREALTLAAVIGQEVPLELWRVVAGLGVAPAWKLRHHWVNSAAAPVTCGAASC